MKTLYLVVLLTLTACAQMESQPDVVLVAVPVPMDATDAPVVLTGAMEVPPVSTTAMGQALIIVNDDGTISGVIYAPNMVDATAAIEDDAADAGGLVIVMLEPVADGRWQVPAGTGSRRRRPSTTSPESSTPMCAARPTRRARYVGSFTASLALARRPRTTPPEAR
jgi:hypothetical protein